MGKKHYHDASTIAHDKVCRKFEKAVKPLIKHLCKHHHPHAKVIVDGTSAELVEGAMVYHTSKHVRD